MLSKRKQRENASSSILQCHHYMATKARQGHYDKRKLQVNISEDIDANFITKYQNTEFNNTLKELFTMGSVGFILVMQRWFDIHKSIKGMHHINRMKNKSHQIISIDAEKVNILSRQKLKVWKAGISKSQDRYDKLLTNHILNSKMWSVFALIRNKNKMLSLTTSKQLVLKSQ